MLVLAFLMVPLLLGPELFELSPELRETFFVLDWFIWAVFALELAIKTYLSQDRSIYLKRHWFDVIIVVVASLKNGEILWNLLAHDESSILRRRKETRDTDSMRRRRRRRRRGRVFMESEKS